jgi:hypothetical protein
MVDRYRIKQGESVGAETERVERELQIRLPFTCQDSPPNAYLS